MAFNLDSWFALSVPARLVCWLSAALCGMAMLWWQTIAPQQKQLLQLSSQQVMREAVRAGQWRKLRALEPPAVAIEPAPLDTCLFSPLNLPLQGQQLVRWQPEQSGGEAELETSWEAAVNIFQRLAECDMQIASFTLTGGEGALRFIVRLE